MDRIAKTPQQSGNFYAYRGQAVYSWALTASLLRPANRKLLLNEARAIRDIISIHPAEFQTDSTMFDRLVRIQHYGMPTRLLDVTINPLVALYFATEGTTVTGDGRVYSLDVAPSRQKYYDSDAVSCVSNLSSLSHAEKESIQGLGSLTRSSFNKDENVDRLIQFVRAEKPYFRSDIDRTDLFKAFHVRPKLSNRRIIAQSGSFIIYGLGLGPSYARTVKLTSIRIPEADKINIRSELHSLGIHEATLFPEIERAAKYVTGRYV